MIRKIFKITTGLLLAIVLLLAGLIVALRIPSVQTWAVKKAASFLSDELGTRVELERIEINFFSTVSIHNLYIEDLHHDTLLFAGELNSAIDIFKPGENRIYLADAELNNAIFKLQKYPNEKGLNINFLIDYFSTAPADTSKPAFDFNPGEIRLNNMTFVYRDNRYNDYFPGVDFEDIRVQEMNALIDDVIFEGDTVHANIKHIEFREKSGFLVEYFEAASTFTPVQMRFDDLLIKTPETQLQGTITFDFEDFTDFDDFIEKVKINSEFTESILSSDDLQFFARELQGMEQTINFSGKIRGTINQLRGKALDIKFGERSHFKGDMNIAGLPDFNESFIDLVVDELITNKEDIESFRQYPFSDNIFIELPDNFSMLGDIRFSGKFTGFPTDFVAYGNARTDLGYLSSDINLKVEKKFNRSTYSGHLTAMGFDVGRLTNSSPMVGRISFSSLVTGRGFSLSTIRAKMDGNVSSLDLNGYNYKNINVDGEISKKLFKGIVSVQEENLALDFKGTIDMTKEIPLLDFTTSITGARLTKLNLIDRDTSSVFSADAIIQIRGTQIDELTGSIIVTNTRYGEINHEINLDSLIFQATNDGKIKRASLRSDIVDMDMSGIYRRSTMFSEIENTIRRYIPVIQNRRDARADVFDIEYSFLFKETDEILEVFMPELKISDSTSVSGKINSISDNIKLDIISDTIIYNDVVFTGINTELSTSRQMLSMETNFKKITVRDTLKFFDVNLTASTDKNKSSFSLATLSRDSANSRFDLKGEIVYQLPRIAQLKFINSEITLNKKNWEINPDNLVIFDTASVVISNLQITNGDEVVKLNGTISKNPEDKVDLQLENFNTSVLNPLLSVFRLEISGVATGESEFNGMLSKPGITSNLNIKDFAVYGDTVGNVTFDLRYDNDARTINLKAFADKGGSRNIVVDGKYVIGDKSDQMNFKIHLEKTNIAAFAGYAKGLVSDIRGKASGDLILSGSFKKPLLTGKVRLQSTSFVVDYLNTRYNFADEIYFEEKYIQAKNITINDQEGNRAIVDGYVYHQNLSDFVLSLEINAKSFQMLNTTASQNELYYGKAYATGKVNINGPLELIQMDLALRTERNTRIFIPLTNPEEVSQSSYITFLSPGVIKVEPEKTEVDLTGIQMNFELDVTPEAEVQLIFDSKIGDVIKGKGSGNITMTINTLGEFRIYGNYQVEEGDYLFTLQNLINKKFIIKEGGMIIWSGSPYSADIDIEGVYKVKTSLYDLLQDTAYKKRVPVEVILRLQEDLFNPTIKFRIDIPEIDPTEQTLVNRYINTEQEINRQTMSLLVLNRFSTAEGVEFQGASSSGVSANAAELLSQQLSVWASQITDVVNVGVSYRAADAFSQEELEVILSTQLFNDRVAVDGNFGVAGNDRNTSDIVGDFNVEVKVSEDGRFRFKAFNKTVNNSQLYNYNSPYTQGIGFFYREEFETVGELMKRFRNWFRKNEPEPQQSMVRP